MAFKPTEFGRFREECGLNTFVLSPTKWINATNAVGIKAQQSFAMKRTRLVRVVECICAMLLIGCTIWVACRYGSLPDRIPTHYGADGVIDGYGGKSMIWAVISIMWVVVGIMSVVEQFPRCWNTGFKLTKENRSRLLALTWHFMSTTKLVISALFAYSVVMFVRGGNPSPLFLPLFLTVLGANSLYWIIKLAINR